MGSRIWGCSRKKMREVSRPGAIPLKAEPGAALFDGALLGSEVKKVAFAGNPFAIQNIDLGVAERRRHFVLYHFDFRAVPDDLLALLQRADSADFDAH